jgi:hypothetical protein
VLALSLDPRGPQQSVEAVALAIVASADPDPLPFQVGPVWLDDSALFQMASPGQLTESDWHLHRVRRQLEAALIAKLLELLGQSEYVAPEVFDTDPKPWEDLDEEAPVEPHESPPPPGVLHLAILTSAPRPGPLLRVTPAAA